MPLGRQIRADIQHELESQGIPCGDECKQIAAIAVEKALKNFIDYTASVSGELMLANLHSEAMVSGVIREKMRVVRDEFI